LILFPLNPGFPFLISIPVSVVGLSIATARLGLLVDINSRTYQEYVSLLGIRFGRKVSFHRIEYLFLKRNNVSQKMSARLASTTVHSEVFDGFIRFSETEKVRVYREKTKDALMKKLLELSARLSVDILDYTKQ